MSVIKINRQHQLPIIELRKIVERIVVDMKNDFSINSQWESDSRLLFRRKGANGFIEFDDSTFEINLKLGMMLRMFHQTIEQQIFNSIEKYI